MIASCTISTNYQDSKINATEKRVFLNSIEWQNYLNIYNEINCFRFGSWQKHLYYNDVLSAGIVKFKIQYASDICLIKVVRVVANLKRLWRLGSITNQLQQVVSLMTKIKLE